MAGAESLRSPHSLALGRNDVCKYVFWRGPIVMQFIGALISILIFLLPVSAIISIVIRRKRNPESSILLAIIVLVGWCIFIGWVVMSFVTGSWYSESGPTPQQAAFEITLVFLLLSLDCISRSSVQLRKRRMLVHLLPNKVFNHRATCFAGCTGLAKAGAFTRRLKRR